MHKEIILKAIELYKSKGLAFTLDEIAKDLHISKKTIYKYFSSKEELLNGIVEYGFNSIWENKKAILDEDIPYLDKLKKLLIALPLDFESIDFNDLEPLKVQYPSVFDNISRHLKSNWEQVFDFIKEGIEKKILRQVPLYMIEIMVTSSMNYLLSNSSNISYQESLNDLADIIMKGMIYEKNWQWLGVHSLLQWWF